MIVSTATVATAALQRASVIVGYYLSNGFNSDGEFLASIGHGFLASTSAVPEPSTLGHDAARLRWPGLRVPEITTQWVVRLN